MGIIILNAPMSSLLICLEDNNNRSSYIFQKLPSHIFNSSFAIIQVISAFYKSENIVLQINILCAPLSSLLTRLRSNNNRSTDIPEVAISCSNCSLAIFQIISVAQKKENSVIKMLGFEGEINFLNAPLSLVAQVKLQNNRFTDIPEVAISYFQFLFCNNSSHQYILEN